MTKPKIIAVRIVRARFLANAYIVAERGTQLDYFPLPSQPIHTAEQTGKALAAFLGVPFELPPESPDTKDRDAAGYFVPQQ